MPRAEDEETGGNASAGSQGASARGGGQSGKGAQPAKSAQPAAGQDDPVAMLKQDHRKVEALLGEFEKADEGRRAVLVKEVCQALIVHAELEEKLFYPAAREAAGEDKLCEAQVEHDAQKVLILELTEANGADRYRDAKFKVLGEEVKQHVKEEEAPDGVLAKAQKAGVATAELAEQMAQMKEQLLQKAQAGRLPEPQPVSLQHFGGRSRQETRMARQSTSRERDEYGRFVSDDDDERGRRRSRADDDDERGYRSRGRDEPDRDERGRFAREDDDDRRYSSRGGGSRERGQGGWFGDSEGHSEASRRGWDEREREGRTSRSSRDDDDRRYASRDRDQGGWFGDPQGHSEASRRGWDEREREREGRSSRSGRDDDERRYASRDRDRGQGGWFGDPQGHSEASRRGWEERESEGRGRSPSEERSYASRRRGDDDEDDRDRDRGRSGGGWSGDPEGHAEAARRGWQNRR